MTSFPVFAPFLAASQQYARHSGCRFRSSSFVGVPDKVQRRRSGRIPVVGLERSADQGPRLAAKLEAAPAVRIFAERLRAAEPALLEEARAAFSLVMTEAVRNAMVAAFRRLELWPPLPAPRGVAPEDCNYQDTAAPLAVVAQRTYNDEMRRQQEQSSTGLPGHTIMQARTAAFIVDFVQEVGVMLPPMPEEQHAALKDFLERVAASESSVDADGLSPDPEAWQGSAQRDATEETGVGSVPPQVPQLSCTEEEEVLPFLADHDDNPFGPLEEFMTGSWARKLWALGSVPLPWWSTPKPRPTYDLVPV